VGRPASAVRRGPDLTFWLLKISFSKTPTLPKQLSPRRYSRSRIWRQHPASRRAATPSRYSIRASGIERQSFLHTASGWLALICLVAGLVLLALSTRTQSWGGRRRYIRSARGPSAPAPVPGRSSNSAPRAVPASSRETGSAGVRSHYGSRPFLTECKRRIAAFGNYRKHEASPVRTGSDKGENHGFHQGAQELTRTGSLAVAVTALTVTACGGGSGRHWPRGRRPASGPRPRPVSSGPWRAPTQR